MTWQAVLLVVGSYLLGSIPGAYVVARLVKGVDLRQYGSGTVSGSMVWEHVGKWALIPVLVLDLGKVLLPTWLGLVLGLGETGAAAAGMAATIGHNWPLFLRFTGGRGMGGFVAIWAVLFPWGVAWFVAFVAIGWRLGDSAPWALAGMVGMPLFAHLVGGPGIVAALSGAMLLLMLAKRLEANRRPLPPPGPERRKVLLLRLFLDRDITDHQAWINRQPNDAP